MRLLITRPRPVPDPVPLIDHAHRSPHTVFTLLRLSQEKTYVAQHYRSRPQGPNHVGFGLSARLDTTVEQIRRNYATTVSLMRCPYHHKDAWVDVEGEESKAIHIEVVTCCQEFEQRVRKLLIEPV